MYRGRGGAAAAGGGRGRGRGRGGGGKAARYDQHQHQHHDSGGNSGDGSAFPLSWAGRGIGPYGGVAGMVSRSSHRGYTMLVQNNAHPVVLGPGTGIELVHEPNDTAYKRSDTRNGDKVKLDTYRSIMCLAVPERIMTQNAESYGDININDATNAPYMRMLTYYLYALYAAHQYDRAGMRVFIEMVVRDRGQLPLCTSGEKGLCELEDVHDTPMFTKTTLQRSIFLRNNFAGYRIWVLLDATSYAPEALMRRALFYIQHRLGMITADTAQFKLNFHMIADEADRRAAITEYATKRVKSESDAAAAAKKAAKKRKAGGDGDDDDDDDNDGSSESTQAAAAAAADGDEMDANAVRNAEDPAQKIESLVYASIKYPPSGDAMRDFGSLGNSLPNMQHYTVTTLQRYVSDVVLSVHRLGSMPLDRLQNLNQGLAQPLAREWGEALDMSQYNRDFLTAEATFSFEASCAALIDPLAPDDGQAVSAQPCAAQLEPSMYGLDDPESPQLAFPLRHLVWQIMPEQLNPESFMNTLFPWRYHGFRHEIALMERELAAQRKRKEDADLAARIAAGGIDADDDGNIVPSYVQNISTVASVTKSLRPSGLLTRAPGRNDAASVRAHNNALLAASSHNRRQQNMANRLSVLSNSNGMQALADAAAAAAAPALGGGVDDDFIDDLQRSPDADEEPMISMNRPDEDAVTKTQYIMSALLPKRDEYRKDWFRANAIIAELEPPAGTACDEHELQVWREQRLCALQELRAVSLMEEIFDVLRHGDVNEVHRNAYTEVTKHGRLSDLFRYGRTMRPNISLNACAIVTTMDEIRSATTLRCGHLDIDFMINVLALQATEPIITDPLNTVGYGAPAIGKSMGMELAQLGTLAGTALLRDHVTEQAAHTTSQFGNNVEMWDETPQDMTTHTREHQKTHAVALRKLKQKTTLQKVTFDRYEKKKEYGPAVTHRVVAFRPHVFTGYFNEGRYQVGAERAMADRMDVFPIMPHTSTRSIVANGVNDVFTEKREAAWLHLCEAYREEHACKSLLVVISRCGIINSFDLQLLRIMQTEAFVDTNRYLPEMSKHARASRRNVEYACMMVYRTAFYKIMRSEVSPLLRWNMDKRAFGGVEPVYLQEMHHRFGPYLYAQWDHGLMMLTRMLRVAYSPVYYLIVRLIAAHECNFRRSYMHEVCRRRGLRTIDDDVCERQAERSDEYARDIMPSFIVELLNDEAVMDNGVVHRCGGDAHKNPTFATVHETASLEHTDEDSSSSYGGSRNGTMAMRAMTPRGGGKRSLSSDASSKFTYADTSCDPNWLTVKGSLVELAKRALGYVGNHLEAEHSQLMTAFEHIEFHVRISVPKLKLVEGFTHHNMPLHRFAYELDSDNKVVYHTVPLMRKHTTPDRRQVVQLATMGLMTPPQYLLALMLSAGENQFTDPHETVIPFEYMRYPGVLHSWSVRKRNGRVLSVIAKTALRPQEAAVMRGMAGNDCMMKDFVAHASNANLSFTENPEWHFFRQHMRELRQMPNYDECIARLSTTKQVTDDADMMRVLESLRVNDERVMPTAEQYELLFKMWVETHPAAPGEAERQRDWVIANIQEDEYSQLRQNPHAYVYPQSVLVDEDVHRMFIECEENNALFPLSKDVEQVQYDMDTIDAHLSHSQFSTVLTNGRMAPELRAARNRLLVQKAALAKVADHLRDYRAAKRAIEHIELRLCAQPWYTTHAIPHYNDSTWTSVMRRVFAKVFRFPEAADDPPTAMTADARTERQQQAFDDVALNEQCKQFSLHFLYALQRIYQFRQYTEDMLMLQIRNPGMSLLQLSHLTTDPKWRDVIVMVATNMRNIRNKRRASVHMTEDEHKLVASYDRSKARVRSMRLYVYDKLIRQCMTAARYEDEQRHAIDTMNLIDKTNPLAPVPASMPMPPPPRRVNASALGAAQSPAPRAHNQHYDSDEGTSQYYGRPSKKALGQALQGDDMQEDEDDVLL